MINANIWRVDIKFNISFHNKTELRCGIKNGVFWDVTPCGFLRYDVSEEMCASVRRLLVTANVVPSSRFPVALVMEVQSSSEKSVLTWATLRNIPEDDILHGHRRENLKSHNKQTPWPLVRERTMILY
jgi:hypothetical protein